MPQITHIAPNSNQWRRDITSNLGNPTDDGARFSAVGFGAGSQGSRVFCPPWRDQPACRTGRRTCRCLTERVARSRREPLHSHAKYVVMLLVGLVAGVATGLAGHWDYAPVVGWDAAALAFCV